MSKRGLDLIGSLVALIIFAPLFIVVSILVKIESAGPVMFRQIRVGKNGATFRIFKFRTMVTEDRSEEIRTTPDDDPQLTKVGRILRKHKIDELPQFINVLKGEMSICGPRPDLPEYIAMLTDEQTAILSVKPGITDWASLSIDTGNLVEGLEDPEAYYMENIRPKKLNLQLEYARHHSFMVDMKIMILTLKTPFTPFFRK